MSLNSALQIGRSGLLAHRAALETAGNNLSNIATPGYHRQVANLTPAGITEVQSGTFVGQGVNIQDVVRRIDEALEGRLRGSIADHEGSLARKDVLTQIESLQNELGEHNLSSQLSQFFNAWSTLANQPSDTGSRSVVIQEGQAIAGYMQDLRTGLTNLRDQTDVQIAQTATSVNDLLTSIESTNQAIAGPHHTESHSVRDQRDQALSDLSELIDISTVERDNGMVDVFVGSTPVVLNGRSRGIEVDQYNKDGQVNIRLRVAEDGTYLDPQAGRLGALIQAREDDVVGAVEDLDRFANQLIYQVNRIHSTGQGTSGLSETMGTVRVEDADAALNSDDAKLPFEVGHGSFEVNITTSTGQRTTTRIDVDLDGINPAGDTTLQTLRDSLDAVDGLAASITPDNRLSLSAENDNVTFDFTKDTSGALAALGVNGFFQGDNAEDIAVAAPVASNLERVAAGRGHVAGDNRNALAIAALADEPVESLGNLSLSQSWRRSVEDLAVRTRQVERQSESNQLVRQSLEAQRGSHSGVNADEEAINLLSHQRAFQASARFLSVVDEMMNTLLQLA